MSEPEMTSPATMYESFIRALDLVDRRVAPRDTSMLGSNEMWRERLLGRAFTRSLAVAADTPLNELRSFAASEVAENGKPTPVRGLSSGDHSSPPSWAVSGATDHPRP